MIRGWTTRLALLAFAAAAAPTLLGLGLLTREYSLVEGKLAGQGNTLARNEAARVAKDLFLLVRSQDEFARQKAKADLAVANEILGREGALHFADPPIAWTAVNQLTGEPRDVKLPGMFAGEAWLGNITDPRIPAPIVDQVQQLVGGICTIFQRMNEEGELIRIATTILNKDGRRAVGTYIPAKLPDGAENLLVKTIISGNVHVGRAYAANSWALGAYQPLFDENKRVVGAIFVGMQLESLASVRAGVADIVVGEHGSAMVIGADGADRGRCLSSYQSHDDGKLLLENDGSDAEHSYVERILATATKLVSGDVAFLEYSVPAPNGAERRMLAAFTYFRPWEWVLVATTEIAGYQGAIERTRANIRAVIYWLALGGGMLVLLATALAWRLARRLRRAALRAATAAERGSSGDLEGGRRALWQHLAQAPPANGDAARAGSSSSSMALPRAPTRMDELERVQWALVGLFDSVQATLGDLRGGADDALARMGNFSPPAERAATSSADLPSVSHRVWGSARELGTASERLLVELTEFLERGETTGLAVAERRPILESVDGAMRRLVEAMGVVSERLGEVHEQVGEFSQVLGTISGVVEQTNLLAINAAIEAEKAGESGTGFLVIAREIRRLSDQAAVAAQAIEKRTSAMHSAVSAGVMALDKLTAAAKHSAQVSGNALGSLPRLLEAYRGLLEQARTIRGTALEQQKRTRDLAELATALDNLARTTSERIENQGARAREIRLVVAGMRETIEKVKL